MKSFLILFVTLVIPGGGFAQNTLQNAFTQIAPCAAGFAIASNVFKVKDPAERALGCIIFHGVIFSSPEASSKIDRQRYAETLEEQLKLEEKRPAQPRFDVSK